MQNQKDISVIIPVYNAVNCIEKLVNEIILELTQNQLHFEIIIVDDGSQDGSWKKIKHICENNSLVKAFCLAKNFGQHKATLCGFFNATGKVIVTIDDDFEHKPTDIIKLYDLLLTNSVDVVYAIPSVINKTLLRKLITALYKYTSKIENPYAGVGSSFRAIKNDLVKKIVSHQNHLFFIDELLLWYTSSIDSCKVNFSVSQKNLSGYNYLKLALLTTNVLMISTTMPLKIVKVVGISMSSISFFIGLVYFIKKIFSITPEGYTSIIVSILFSTGIILFCIAIIGEYLGNVLMMQNNKPAYYIKEEI